ncbi:MULTISPECIES: hypothetical protein [Streptococcus]|uniref:hypothetical protein n=1 Tax=Streptococcus TaxID=1301 RepID=UPI000CF5BA8E|nr:MULTISPECIES: hypothetical protein [Streptococcus]MBM7267984.1 hypothetical protein [Streptococcus suis]MBY0753163.1 hypothetical protein [Streptococcus sp. 2018037]
MKVIQQLYLKKLGQQIRNQMKEKKLMLNTFEDREIRISISTVSRVIHAKNNIKIIYLPLFLEILEIDTLLEFYFFDDHFCFELIENTLDLIVHNPNSKLYRRFAKLLRRKYPDFDRLTTYALARIYFLDNKNELNKKLNCFVDKLLLEDRHSYEVAEAYAEWVDDILTDF